MAMHVTRVIWVFSSSASNEYFLFFFPADTKIFILSAMWPVKFHVSGLRKLLFPVLVLHAFVCRFLVLPVPISTAVFCVSL
jgi:hypothetical protein